MHDGKSEVLAWQKICRYTANQSNQNSLLFWVLRKVNVVSHRERFLFEVQTCSRSDSPTTIRLSCCTRFAQWQFQTSVATFGCRNIFNKVTLEVRSSPCTIKQGTDIEKVVEYHPKTRKDAKTGRVSHIYGTTVGRRKLGAGNWGTRRWFTTSHTKQLLEMKQSLQR